MEESLLRRDNSRENRKKGWFACLTTGMVVTFKRLLITGRTARLTLANASPQVLGQWFSKFCSYPPLQNTVNSSPTIKNSSRNEPSGTRLKTTVVIGCSQQLC